MVINRFRYGWFARILGFVSIAVLLIAFQNCGKGFESQFDGNFMELSSQAPSVTILEAPEALINQRQVSVLFEVKANPYAKIQDVSCRLNDLPPQACNNEFTVTGLEDGDHQLVITAIDNYNNTSQEKVITWRVDATQPVVTINAAPPEVSALESVTFNFIATDNLSGVAVTECAFDGGAFTSCMSPLSYNGLAEKSYQFRLRARDVAGNMSDEVMVQFRIDRTVPVINIVNAPTDLTTNRNATFAFNGIDEGIALTAFECRLDNGNFSACSSPHSYNNLQDGTHTFALRARDLAGNLSSVLTRTWMIDSTAPSLQFVSAPQNATNQTNATFLFTPNDNGGSGVNRTECSLDNGPFGRCESPVSYQNLPSGNHTFAVRAIDNAGNISNILEHNWLIDVVPPTVTIQSSVSGTTSSTTAVITMTTSDGNGSGVKSLECRLDTQPFAICPTTRTYTNLQLGPHTFTARVTDLANNQTTATHTWTISSTAPPTTPTPTPTPAPLPTPPPTNGDAHAYFDYLTGLPERAFSMSFRTDQHIRDHAGKNYPNGISYDSNEDAARHTVRAPSAPAMHVPIGNFGRGNSNNVLLSWEFKLDPTWAQGGPIDNVVRVYKAFQLAYKESGGLYREIRFRFDQASAGNVAATDVRAYQGGTAIGNADAMTPQAGNFQIKANKWTRIWVLMDFQNQEFSYWIADEDRAPVKIIDRNRDTFPQNLTYFWWEYNTSQEGSVRTHYIYSRNLVVLKNVSNAQALVNAGANNIGGN